MSKMRVPANTPLVSLPQDKGERRYDLKMGMVPQKEASSAMAFGGAAAAGLGAMELGLHDMGRLLTGVSIDLQRREDETNALDAYNQLNERVGQFFYGDGSPESGLYNRKGAAVVNSVKDTKEFFDKNVSELAGNLTPNAAEAFQARADALRFGEQRKVAVFESDGREKWQFDTYKAAAAGEMRTTLDNFGTPRLREESLARGTENVRNMALMRGEPPELVEERVRAYQAEVMVAGAEQELARGNFGGAMAAAMDPSLDEAQRLGIVQKAVTGEVQARVNAGDIAGAQALVNNYSGGIVGASAAYGGKGPRGIRNNNPGNIIKTSSAWAGEVQGGDSRFKSFATPEHGIAAVGKNLQAYNSKGINTVRGIIHKWAPPKENNTGSYVNAVAKALGVSPDVKVDVKDPAVLTLLTKAIIKHENGNIPYSEEQIQTGVEASLGMRELAQPAVSAELVPAAGPAGFITGGGGGILPPDKVAQLSDMIDRAEKTQHEAQVAYGVQVFTSSLPEALAGVPFEQWDSIARGMAAQYPLEIRSKALEQWKDVKEVYQDKVNMNDAVLINNALAEYKDMTVGEVRLAMEARKDKLRQKGLSPDGFKMLDKVLANYGVETQENIKSMNKLRTEIAQGMFGVKGEDAVRAAAYERGLTQGQADKIVEFFNNGGQSGMIYANKAIIDYYGKYYLGEDGWENAQIFDYYAALEPTLPPDRDATKEDIQRAMRDLCLSSEFRDAAVAYSKDRNKRGDYERLRPPNEEEFETERKRLREKLGYEPSHDQVVMSFRKANTGAERTREARRQLGAF